MFGASRWLRRANALNVLRDTSASNRPDSAALHALSETLKGLCANLQDSYDATVRQISSVPVHVDANHATTRAVIINELVTNAIKHGDGQVKVSCSEDQGTLRIAISNGGSMLPEGARQLQGLRPQGSEGHGQQPQR
jgi:two-component sensor histidine kinase